MEAPRRRTQTVDRAGGEEEGAFDEGAVRLDGAVDRAVIKGDALQARVPRPKRLPLTRNRIEPAAQEHERLVDGAALEIQERLR